MTHPTANRRKLVLKMSMSLDGLVAGPHGEADWIFRSSGGEDATAWLLDTLGGAGVHIMGSGSYRDMAAFWPYSDLPIAAPMNAIPKLVFARSGLQAPRGTPATTAADAAALASWTEPAVARGDLVEELQRLKAQPGRFILAHGGARFARSLVATGLVDEYRLVIHPVVLGQGMPLFAGLRAPVDLRLVDVTSFSSGVVAAVYRPG